MRERRLLFAILVAAALLRAAWSVAVGPAAFLEVDGTDYRDIARNLATGLGYSVSAPRWFEPAALLPPGPHPDFARAPLLPVLGAVLFRAPGPWDAWAHALMVAAGVLAVWLAFRAGASFFDRRTGLLAAAILALQPYAIWYSGRWSTETPFLVLVLATVVVLAESRGLETRRAFGSARLALAGLLIGLASMARPTGLVLAPGFALWILARGPSSRGLVIPSRRGLAGAGVFLAAAALTLTPWTIRNHAATGRWNPGTFFGPYNLWLGMNDRDLAMHRAAGTPRFTAELEALSHGDSRAMVRKMEALGIVGPVAEGRHWSDAARTWMRTHPRRTVELIVRHAIDYFRVTPERSIASRSVRVASLFLWPVHLLALVALWWRRGRTPWLVLTPPLVGLLAGLPFAAILRYRFPFVDPYAAILAAAALGEIPGRLRQRSAARSAPGREHLSSDIGSARNCDVALGKPSRQSD